MIAYMVKNELEQGQGPSQAYFIELVLLPYSSAPTVGS